MTKKISTKNVDHPAYYNPGSIEVIDVLEDWDLGLHLSEAVKHIVKAKKKDEEPLQKIEELEKAIWYINRYINGFKCEAEIEEAIELERNTEIETKEG